MTLARMAATPWPNWVDLIIVILIFRACYSGFVRGILAELLSLVGAVTVTALAVNYSGVVASWLQPWLAAAPYVAALMGFWSLFGLLVVIVRVVSRRVTDVLKWERLHWFVQGVGLFLGGVRGLWWAGFLLIVLVSSGVPFLATSVEQGSVLGPRLLAVAQGGLEQVANRFPGSKHRPVPPVPPVQPTTRGR